MGSQVDKVVTPLGELEIAAVLRDAHHATFGDFPEPARLAMGWAQIAEEHARGRAIWCHNFGNATTPKLWWGDYYVIRVEERIGPKDAAGESTWVWKDMRFIANPTALDGAGFYWSLLAHHYAAALACFDKGDPIGATRALADGHYFTVEEAKYERAMRLLYAEARARILPRL